MLNCQHHISWVRAVEGGLHQCILCTAVVTKKDVYPKLEDLPAEFGRRWDEHERRALELKERAPSPQPSPPLRGGEGVEAPSAAATAPPPPSESAGTDEAGERPAPFRRVPVPPRVSVPPADPHPRG